MLGTVFLQRSFIDLAAAHSRGLAVASSQMTAIKSLRERTNAPISDVKSALIEADWDLGVASIDVYFRIQRDPRFQGYLPSSFKVYFACVHIDPQVAGSFSTSLQL